MRLSFVLDTFGGGGKERRCLQLIQGLNRKGYNDIQVIIVNDTVRYDALYDTSAEVRIIDRKGKNLNFFQTRKAIKGLFKEFKPDIVQSWGWLSTFLSASLKQICGYNLIGSYVADVFGTKTLSLKTLYPLFCDKIVGNSQAGLNAYRIPKKKAVLIYNGFNESRYETKVDNDVKKEELGIQTRFVVAMIASFWKTKDWVCYLTAAKRVVAARKDVSFLAVGDGPDWESCNQMIEEGERELIKMLGRRNDTDEILQVCDLTVLTSTLGEGVSNSIVESMAFGVPVIATNKGGTPEILIDGYNGFLLSNNDVGELVDKIEILLNDSSLHKVFSENAALTIRKNFQLETMTNRYIELYRSLL